MLDIKLLPVVKEIQLRLNLLLNQRDVIELIKLNDVYTHNIFRVDKTRRLNINFGLCSFISEDLRPIFERSDVSRASDFIREIFKSWKYFSGSSVYPVPTSAEDDGGSPSSTYGKYIREDKNLFGICEYGQMRWKLIGYVYDQLSAEIEKAEESRINPILADIIKARNGHYCHALELHNVYEFENIIEAIMEDYRTQLDSGEITKKQVAEFFHSMQIYYLEDETLSESENSDNENAIYAATGSMENIMEIIDSF